LQSFLLIPLFHLFLSLCEISPVLVLHLVKSQKLSEAILYLLQDISSGLTWWHLPVIPAIQEVELGGSWSKPKLLKSVRPYLKTKLKAKRLEVWLKW
jgi:hypothetical protein